MWLRLSRDPLTIMITIRRLHTGKDRDEIFL